MRLKDFTPNVRAALATLAAAIALSAQAQQAAPADTTASAMATPDSTATATATPDSMALRTDSIATAISHVQAVTDSIARSLDASLGATDSVARSDAMSFLPASDSLPATKKRLYHLMPKSPMIRMKGLTSHVTVSRLSMSVCFLSVRECSDKSTQNSLMWRELDGQSLKNHPLYRMYIVINMDIVLQ